ncbi:exopolyphosphatase domain protein [Mycobacterium kansasii 824]|nr:exopolyphosphatase domain protein [Mycobacterium kansasii 824]
MTATETGAPSGIEDVMALSPLQEGLYSLTVLSGLADAGAGSPVDDPYLVGIAADIAGPLDVDLLKDCAAEMLMRHPNLRASFVSRDIPGPCRSCRRGSSCPGAKLQPSPRISKNWRPRNGLGRSTSKRHRRSVSC